MNKLTKSALLSALIATSAFAQSNDPVANEALALANYNSIRNMAHGSDNCYSAYAVSQAYYRANYYNAQIEYSMQQHIREMEKLNKRIRGDR
jgi:hypothetical protein